MKKAFLLLLAISCFAQTQPNSGSRGYGFFYAPNYNYGVSSPGGHVVFGNSSTGAATLTARPGYAVLSDGRVIAPYATHTPVTVDSGPNQETVTPTSVSGCATKNSNICTINASFTHTHGQGALLSSGTGGLQEAINDAVANGGGAVTVDSSWAGTTSQITNAFGNSNVAIKDLRTGEVLYTWNGTNYVVTASGGGGTVTNVGVDTSATAGLFSAHVNNSTTTPTTVFSPTSMAAHQVYGNCGGSGTTECALQGSDIPPIDLSTTGSNGGIENNLGVSHLASGTNATTGTYFQGSNSWGCPVTHGSTVDAYCLRILQAATGSICDAIDAAFQLAGTDGGIVDATGFSPTGNYHCSASSAFNALSHCTAGYVVLGPYPIFIDQQPGLPGFTSNNTRCGGIRGSGRGDTGSPGTTIGACHGANDPAFTDPLTGEQCHAPTNSSNGTVGRSWKITSLGSPTGTGNLYQLVTVNCGSSSGDPNPDSFTSARWPYNCPHAGEMVEINFLTAIGGISHFDFMPCAKAGFYPQNPGAIDVNCPGNPAVSASSETFYIVNPSGASCGGPNCGTAIAFTPLLRLGDNTNLVFGFRASDFNIDCRWVQGCEPAENIFAQEESGLYHMKLTGYQGVGFQTYSIQSQFARHEDLEIYQGQASGQNVCNHGTVGVFVGGGGGNLSFTRVSVAQDHCPGSGDTAEEETKGYAGFLIDGSNVSIENSHSEGPAVGVVYGKDVYATGNYLVDWSAAQSFPNVDSVLIHNNFATGNPYSTSNNLLELLHGASGTNTLHDLIKSITRTGLNEGQYIWGSTGCSITAGVLECY